MPRHIPVELYAPIFQHITSKAELSNLCMVSRAFRHEAQRILYHAVRLSTNYESIISWCHTIVGNPGLAMQVYALSLPNTFEPRTVQTVKPQELQQVVKRALSSLSRLVELEIYASSGTLYVDSDMFRGHPFRLQVFSETLPDSPRTLEYWLEFLSEQPGIRHWRSGIMMGPPMDPDVLPSLTSAEVYSHALDILSPCPMIRALQVNRWSSGYSEELSALKAFRRRLTRLTVVYFENLLAVAVVRDAVPDINFLGLQLDLRVKSAMFQPLMHLCTQPIRSFIRTPLPTYSPNSHASRISPPSSSRCPAMKKTAGAGPQTQKKRRLWRQVS
jgi:hypothetical protein